jgi:hypothetical protein
LPIRASVSFTGGGFVRPAKLGPSSCASAGSGGQPPFAFESFAM